MTGTLKDTGCKPQAHGEAAPGGGPCPRCGRPRCCASAKSRPGERCRRNPHPGATICDRHGLTEAGRAKAAEVVAGAAAERAIGELVPLLASASPVKDPVDLLARCLSVLEAMADTVAARVNALNGKVGTGEHLAQLRAEVVLLDRVQDRIVKGAGKLADLGIAERQVELAAGQADIAVGAYRAALAVAGAVLLPEVRDAMTRTYMLGIGVPPEWAGADTAGARRVAAALVEWADQVEAGGSDDGPGSAGALVPRKPKPLLPSDSSEREEP